MKNLLVATLLALLPVMVVSHSKVDTTVPADGAVLTAAPDEIEFAFAKGLRMTLAVLHSDSAETELDLPDQDGFGTRLSVPLDLTGPGQYRIEWRGLSVDGHAVTGTVTFTLE